MTKIVIITLTLMIYLFRLSPLIMAVLASIYDNDFYLYPIFVVFTLIALWASITSSPRRVAEMMANDNRFVIFPFVVHGLFVCVVGICIFEGWLYLALFWGFVWDTVDSILTEIKKMKNEVLNEH